MNITDLLNDMGGGNAQVELPADHGGVRMQAKVPEGQGGQVDNLSMHRL